MKAVWVSAFAPFDTIPVMEVASPQPAAGEVVIEVKAAGMNFRDVLKALALYPAETADARIFGDEVAGVVKAVGAGVTHVKAGDRVFGRRGHDGFFLGMHQANGKNGTDRGAPSPTHGPR